MHDTIVLGLRAASLQETILHHLAEACGAYIEEGLSVEALVGRSEDGIDVGLASSLFETADGTVTWQLRMVVCLQPLFWVVRACPATEPFVVGVNTTIDRLLRLAFEPERADPGGGLRPDHLVVAAAAIAEIATGRMHPEIDIGAEARFPSIGLAVRPGIHDADAAARLVRAHREALRVLHEQDLVVLGVLRRHHGISAVDGPSVLALLRDRFHEVDLGDAARHAQRACTKLGYAPEAVAGAFLSTDGEQAWS